jgi:phosphoenolpyruvate---glycerone phosphotransferase subunit DhaL
VRIAPLLDAAFVRRWVAACAQGIADQRDYLTQLDAAIGDADHGVNMDRGFSAALSALEAAESATPGELLVQTGTTLMFRVGGAAGPLYGTIFREAGRSVGSRRSLGRDDLLAALGAALLGVQKLGAAVDGDKTMVDAWLPALTAFRSAASGSLVDSTRLVREAAEAGAGATTPMQARKGRASYLGPRSVGHQDPGATSSAILFAALERAVRES